MSETQVYEGKVKRVEFLDDEKVRIIFLDTITAGDGAKKDTITGKGAMNLELSNLIMEKLAQAGIPHHVLQKESENTVIARRLDIIPLEVVVRNITAGSFCRRYGIQEGLDLDEPIVEFFVKDDNLHDPLIDPSVAINQGMITRVDLELLRARALQVNEVLNEYFMKADMLLVDFKLEFGKDKFGDIYLGDEISADSMRVWDLETREKLDKDRFRKDLGDVLAGYKVIIDRLEAINYQPSKVNMGVKIVIEPKENVTNPSGEVVKRTLVNGGLEQIGTVRMGKIIDIELTDTSGQEWWKKLDKISQELLSNPMIESYQFTFE